MPNWNQLRPSKKHDSPPSSSSTGFTDSLNGSDNEDDFAPLISLQELPDEKLDVEDQGGSRQLGRRRSLIRNAGDSLSKRWGLGGGGFSDANDDGLLSPTRAPSIALRGNKSPTFTLPRTRFSLTRRTISSRDMVKSGGGTKNQTSPTKKKRSYLLKRCDLPEVKERKESVASSLQKYLDIDDDEEPEVPARPANKVGDALDAKNNGSLTSISFISPKKKKKDKVKKTKKKESKSSTPTSKNTAASVFGAWGEKSWGEKSWGNISWGNTSNTDVSSKPSEKRKKKKTRGDNKKRHSSSKKQPSPQTRRRPPRSPHSMTKRVPPPSPRIFPSTQVRGVQLNFDGMNSRSELPHMPAIESPLNV